MTILPTLCLRAQPAALRARLLAWLFVGIFMLQQAFAAEHHHDAPAKTRHCVTCALHVQPHAGRAEPIAPAAPAGLHFLHYLLFADAAIDCIAPTAYLLPPAQGPPDFLQAF